MSDDRPDDEHPDDERLDAEIRDALRVEADDVVAAPDALDRLVDAVRAAGPVESRTGGPSGRALLIAAVVVLVAGTIGVGVALNDGARVSVGSEQPASSGSTTTQAPAAVSLLPIDFFATTVDGRAVRVEVASGTVIQVLGQLDPYDTPDGSTPEGGSQVFESISTDAGHHQVTIDECCEPAAGMFRLVDGDTGALDAQVLGGISPRLDRTGDLIAVQRSDPAGGPPTVVTLGTRLLDAPDFSLSTFSAGTVMQHMSTPSAWSPDSRHLVGVESSATLDPLAIVWADSETGESKRFEMPDGKEWSEPVIRADGKILVVEQTALPSTQDPTWDAERQRRSDEPSVGRVLDPSTGAVVASIDYGGHVTGQRYDATGTWLLYQLGDAEDLGTWSLRWMGGGRSGDLGAGYVYAAW